MEANYPTVSLTKADRKLLRWARNSFPTPPHLDVFGCTWLVSLDRFLATHTVNKTTKGNMISNERPSPYGRRPERQPYGSHHHGYTNKNSYSTHGTLQKAPVQDTTLRSERLVVERKTFIISLKENDRGRFLRIIEESNGHRDMIIVPSTGLEEFSTVLEQVVTAASETQSPQSPS
jgi:hypothetical protein